ncbi:MAG: imidazole glycerol phosphate synthase subunit HisH, partial [Robiginitomaculum sp.]
ICLGMQLLFDRSAEAGGVDCLGMIDGEITAMETGDLPRVHMGWNQLNCEKTDPLLDDVSSGDYAYFVHSYSAPVSDYTLASSAYGDSFSAVVRRGNVYGCQFHPERSGATGAKILANFLKVSI